MRTLLIGYDLNKEAESGAYDDLHEAIKESGAWWHHLDSTWLVRTELAPKAMRDKLAQLIDRNDELLVIDVTGDSAAWRGFSDRGRNWLLRHL